jgi:hypothetical protein
LGEFAQADQPAPSATPASALELLQAARERVKQYSSVKTNIVEKVSIGDHSFTSTGSYLQGKDLQMRLALTLEIGGHKGSLLEVCDGQVLWTRHDIKTGDKGADQPQITRRDVREILKAAQKNGRVPISSLVADLGLGGLSGLLAAFESDMTFKKEVTAENIDGRPVLTIEGSWNDEYLKRFGASEKKKDARPELPLFIPDVVRISFDKETEFLRRIVYLKALPGRSVLQPMLTVDFLKPVFNGPVSENDFQFTPPDRPSPVDITQLYLQRLLPPPSAPGAKPDAPAAPSK